MFSVRSSLLLTLDDAIAYWNYDIGVNLTRLYRVDQLEREALTVPGVIAAESWGFLGAIGASAPTTSKARTPADCRLQPTADDPPDPVGGSLAAAGR